MNEQLQAELIKIVTSISNGATTAWGFLTEQTPDVIQQLLLWHGIKSFIAFCVAIIFIIAGLIITAKLFKYSKELSAKSKDRCNKSDYRCYDPTPFFAMWFVPLVVCISVTPLVIFENLTWLQIWVAPKTWILEYIKDLTN